MTELRKLSGAHWGLYKQKIEILKRQADEDSIPKYSDNIEKFRFKNKAYIYIYIYKRIKILYVLFWIVCLHVCKHLFLACFLAFEFFH